MTDLTRKPRVRGCGTAAPRSMMALAVALAVALSLGACAHAQRGAAAGGGQHTYRSSQPPERAARCFARNAEEHSSALAAEVTPLGDRVEVHVRVKNGVPYATAEFRGAGAGSVGSIALMVVTSGRRSDLLDSLTKGC